ncbi:MAG: glucose 1-dehydrogenase [Chlamydiales bacterium]|nr:glucose 1-dehydrogenase [Chlamydiales bacterium]
MKLSNKTAIISGGTSGIGLAIAKEFLLEGANVAVFGRNQNSIDVAKKELSDGNSLVMAGDVINIKSLDNVYETIGKKFGKCDILVVNAGIFKPTPLELTDENAFQEIMDINLKGAFFTVQRSLPLLREGGSIILIASTSGIQGCTDFSVYNASKAALRSLSQSFAADLLSKNIRVNSISPGFIRTPIQDKLGISEEMIIQCESAIPLKRFGQPREIAKAAVFLASDDSSYITGSDMLIDGGQINIAPPF